MGACIPVRQYAWCNVGGSMIAGQHACMYVCGAVCARVMHVGLVCVHVSVRGHLSHHCLLGRTRRSMISSLCRVRGSSAGR